MFRNEPRPCWRSSHEFTRRFTSATDGCVDDVRYIDDWRKLEHTKYIVHDWRSWLGGNRAVSWSWNIPSSPLIHMDIFHPKTFPFFYLKKKIFDNGWIQGLWWLDLCNWLWLLLIGKTLLDVVPEWIAHATDCVSLFSLTNRTTDRVQLGLRLKGNK